MILFSIFIYWNLEYFYKSRINESRIIQDYNKNEIPDVPIVSDFKAAYFGEPLTLRVGEKAKIDGLTPLILTLKKINDSRCKPGVQCIWAGELSSEIDVHFGNLDVVPDKIILGTVNSQNLNLKGYIFSLSRATENSATIIVKKDAAAKNPLVGYVSGHVNIGPFCPVERVDEPCKVPDEAYTSREAVVYSADKSKILDRIHLDKNGNYKLVLSPGNYFIQIVPAGIGPGEMKPVSIKSSATSTVNFDIDTGIR